MVQKFIVTASLIGCLCTPTLAQRCEILGVDHFGGNSGDACAFPYVIEHNSKSHSLAISTVSTAGNILTGCPSPSVSFIFRDYDPTFTTFEDRCATFGNDFAWPSFTAFRQPNGDTILFGQSQLHSQDVIAERRNASGGVVWNKTFGGSGPDGFHTVIPMPDGGFLVDAATSSTDGDIPSFFSNNGFADIWVFRLDNDGNIQWSTMLGGSGTDLPRDFKLSADGGCYVFGVTVSTDYDAAGNHGSSDLFIAKLDSMGNKEWTRCYGGTDDDGCGYDLGIRAIADKQGGFYVLNRATSHDGDVQRRIADDTDFWLLHIDSAGNILWENTYGGPFNQYPSAFCQSTDGSLWMGGYFYGDMIAGGQIDVTYGSTDCWVVHADTLGNFINQRVIGSNMDDALTSLSPLPDGSVMAVGDYMDNVGKRSPGFPATTEGLVDIYLAHLGPNTVGIIDEPIAADSWEIFPNPGSDKVQVKRHQHDKQIFTLTATDPAGKERYRSVGSKDFQLNTSQWQAGIYFLKLTDADGRSGIKKLVLHR